MPETDPAQETQAKQELSDSEINAYQLRATFHIEPIESDLFYEKVRKIVATAKLRGVTLTPEVIQLIADIVLLDKDRSIPSLSTAAVAWERQLHLTSDALKTIESGISIQEFLSNPDLQKPTFLSQVAASESSQGEALHERELSELLAQLDASKTESSQRQAVIAELRQIADAELADLAEVVAAL